MNWAAQGMLFALFTLVSVYFYGLAGYATANVSSSPVH